MLIAKDISPYRPLPAWRSPIHHSVAAGFPSPADDYLEPSLNLQDLLVPHPVATFFVRVQGRSMLGAGIHDGDILVVDRSLEPRPGRIAVVVLDAEFTVKRLALREGRLILQPENDQFAPIEVQPHTDFEIWGIVTSIIHRV